MTERQGSGLRGEWRRLTDAGVSPATAAVLIDSPAVRALLRERDRQRAAYTRRRARRHQGAGGASSGRSGDYSASADPSASCSP